MKKLVLVLITIVLIVTTASSQVKPKQKSKEKAPTQKQVDQKQTFDIATYTPPKGWKREATDAAVQFIHQDSVKGTYCIIMLMKSLPGTSVPKQNFDTAWQTLVKEIVTPLQEPKMEPSTVEKGWSLEYGAAPFEKDGEQGAVMLVTATAKENMVSTVIITNSDSYTASVMEFLNSITLKDPNTLSQTTTQKTQEVVAQKEISAPAKTAFAFNTTNFDDGWTSVEKADWVEVTKGTSRVLLHYPNNGIKAANTDPDVMCSAAWNVLVAPRYSNIQNYKVGPSVLDYERPYYAEAFLTDNTSGKTVFVVLFKKGTGWMEFITPSREAFIQTFKVDISKIDYYVDSDVWNPMKLMANYNRFAIGAGDFTGKWSDHFSSNTYYANVYTGLSAGMSTYSSSQSFEFFSGNKYKWNLVAVNSYGGSSQFAQGKGQGTFKVLNNWQIYFSEMEGKPKTYNAYFSCVKGSRILWIIDAQYPGSGLYTGFSKE